LESVFTDQAAPNGTRPDSPRLRVGGMAGRFRLEMPVIWVAGPWVTAALRTSDRPAAMSRGTSCRSQGKICRPAVFKLPVGTSLFGSEIENKTHWAGQLRVVPLFWSL
jgi:hypothetical protein